MDTEFTPCLSPHCSACQEVRRLREVLAKIEELHQPISITFEEPWPNGFIHRDYCSKSCRTAKGARLRHQDCPTAKVLAS